MECTLNYYKAINVIVWLNVLRELTVKYLVSTGKFEGQRLLGRLRQSLVASLEQRMKPYKVQKTEILELHVFFHKKLGSGHSTKSFLIQHEILSIVVLKVS